MAQGAAAGEPHRARSKGMQGAAAGHGQSLVKSMLVQVYGERSPDWTRNYVYMGTLDGFVRASGGAESADTRVICRHYSLPPRDAYVKSLATYSP
jgi:hypothetical protein